MKKLKPVVKDICDLTQVLFQFGKPMMCRICKKELKCRRRNGLRHWSCPNDRELWHKAKRKVKL